VRWSHAAPVPNWSRVGGERLVAELSPLLVLLALAFAYLATYW
jgi:hypothetical protein